MNYSLGQFVVSAGHTLGWIAALLGAILLGAGAIHGSTAEVVVGAYVMGGAVSALILATIGSAQLVTAQCTEKMCEIAVEAERKERMAQKG